MSDVSRRLRRRVERDFAAHEVPDVLSLLSEASAERVQAAIVLAASGRLEEVRHGAALARLDWRDVLMNGSLAHADWRVRLEEELGPEGR